MYKLPEDVEREIILKYPDYPVKQIINSVIQGIIDKTCMDAACHIDTFGKFVAFKTTDGKTKQDAIRFKFRPTQVFLKRLKDDNFLLKNLPYTEPRKSEVFNKDQDEIKKLNNETEVEAANKGIYMTKEKVKNILFDEATDEITEL